MKVLSQIIPDLNWLGFVHIYKYITEWLNIGHLWPRLHWPAEWERKAEHMGDGFESSLPAELFDTKSWKLRFVASASFTHQPLFPSSAWSRGTMEDTGNGALPLSWRMYLLDFVFGALKPFPLSVRTQEKQVIKICISNSILRTQDGRGPRM